MYTVDPLTWLNLDSVLSVGAASFVTNSFLNQRYNKKMPDSSSNND